jgi:hypothetical protein
MYELYVSFRVFLRFFFSPSAGAAAFFAVFFAAVFSALGALAPVEAGAFPAVDAGYTNAYHKGVQEVQIDRRTSYFGCHC